MFGGRRGRVVEFVSQTDRGDCGHACLSMLLTALGSATNIYELKASYPAGGMGLSARQMKEIAAQRGVGLKAMRATNMAVDAIASAGLPVIAHYKREHYVVVTHADGDEVTVLDPASGKSTLSRDEFASRWSGVFFSADRSQAVAASARPHGLLEEILGFLRTHHSTWAVMVTVALITGVTVVAIPWLLSKALTIFAYGSGNAVRVLLAGFAAMLAMLVFAQWLRSRAAISIQVACDRLLTFRLIEKIVKLPVAVFTSISPGDFISRVNALVSVRDFLTSRIAALFVDLVIVFATAVAVGLQSGLILLAFLGLSLLTCGSLFLLRDRLKTVVAKNVLSYTRYYECMTETLSSAIDVKATGRELAFERRWKDAFEDYQQEVEARGRLGAVLEAVYAYQERVVPIAALLLVAVAAPVGSIAEETMFFTYFLMIWTAPSLRSLQTFAMQLVAVSINNERIRSITSLDPEKIIVRSTTSECSADAGLGISARGVSFTYRSGRPPILEKLDCSFRGPGLKVIVGPSGSGKSTLLRLMAGLLAPDAGSISVQHPPLDPEQPAIGYLNQHPALFSGTVAENICLFDQAPDLQRVAECARIACVHDEIMALPEGFQTVLFDRGGDLSAGQRQRIALARLLYSRPHVLLLDEFTSDVDGECEKQIVANLRKVDALIVVATHRLAWVRRDEIVVDLGAASAFAGPVQAAEA